MGCFFDNAALMMKMVDKGGIDIKDEKAMEGFGIEIATEMFRQNCSAFAQLSLLMVDSEGSKSKADMTDGVTGGRLTRIDNKEFLYFVVTDTANREQSFIWLRYFQGSEKFIKDPASYIGKPLKIRWQEIEVFMPVAKGYFKIKEIAGIDVE
jgi:hypothetical protein